MPKQSILQSYADHVPLLSHHPEEIARQMTLAEFDLFSRVMVRMELH
jgi:hypothetical protein